MTEASSLSILVDEKKVNDLLKQKTGAKAFLKSGCNLFAFIFFISLFTFMALSEPLHVHRSFTAFIRHRFDEGAAVRLSEVNSITDWYHYLNYTVIPGMYGNSTRQYTFPGAQIQKMLKIDGAKSNNRLFGLLRIRQVRVAPKLGCQLHETYAEAFPVCYGHYGEETEDKSAFGPIDSIGGPLYKYYNDAQSEKSSQGWLAGYHGHGFVQVMHSNYSKSVEMIPILMENRWVSLQARALWFEFSVYNLNLGLYAVCRIQFEISPVGGWLKKFEIDILDQRHLQPLGDKGLMAWVLLIMEAVLVIFVVRYLCEEMSEFLACDASKPGKNVLSRLRVKWEYFMDGWNILDWANLVLMIVVMGFRFTNWGISGGKELFLGPSLEVDQYVNLHDVVQNVRTIRQLTAFNAVLTWFKAVKYISILPYITTFMETMALSWKYLVGWGAIFITSFMGFCLSYSTAFGESISDFRTVPRAFVFLMRAFIGNAKMEMVYDANPVIGSMLTLFFVTSMIFVNMNLFYAIIISFMSDARATQEMAQAREMAKFNDKCMGFVDTVVRVTQLGARFRGCFPGLWTRMKTWEKKEEVLEIKREERLRLKALAQNPNQHAEINLGSANPGCGRRKKRNFKQTLDPDADSEAEEEVESEPDLGPLRFAEQLEPQPEEDEEPGHHAHHHHHHLDTDEYGDVLPPPEAPPPGMMCSGYVPEESVIDRDENAKELVLEATEHVVSTIKDRCKGARQLVIGEMGEARQVLQGIGNVLEVLGRRARSLEAQQEQILPPEIVARTKAMKEADEDFDW